MLPLAAQRELSSNVGRALHAYLLFFLLIIRTVIVANRYTALTDVRVEWSKRTVMVTLFGTFLLSAVGAASRLFQTVHYQEVNVTTVRTVSPAWMEPVGRL